LTRGKKAFKIKDSRFELGETADFTLFSPKGSRRLEKSDLYSTSKNCLFLGSTIKGKVYGSLRSNKLQLNN
jgi:dihydroorotase